VYDPLLEDLLKTVGANETAGHTRRVRQIEEILSSVTFADDDVVLECFSGPGSLTIPMALKCRRVIAVEVDSLVSFNLHQQLEILGIRNVDFIIGDICAASTREAIRARAEGSALKHLHTPGYRVIPETISACASLPPVTLTMVLPLSLLRREWAWQDYHHVAEAHVWFEGHVRDGSLEVLGVHPLRKLSGMASSGIFRLLCRRPMPIIEHVG